MNATHPCTVHPPTLHSVDAPLAHTALTFEEGASRAGSRAASAPQSLWAAASRPTV